MPLRRPLAAPRAVDRAHGRGDPGQLDALAADDDVVAHELDGHGVQIAGGADVHGVSAAGWQGVHLAASRPALVRLHDGHLPACPVLVNAADEPPGEAAALISRAGQPGGLSGVLFHARDSAGLRHGGSRRGSDVKRRATPVAVLGGRARGRTIRGLGIRCIRVRRVAGRSGQ